MRVVMVSKALVVEAYRGKLAALARLPDIELTAIVPPWWPEGGRRVDFRPAPIDREAGYQVVVEPQLLAGNFHLHWYPGLGRRLRELRPDIVHIDEEPYNLATFLALLAAKRAGARVLFFTWQNIFKRYPWPFGAFERFVLRHTNYALAGNRAAAAILRRKGYHGPVAVIPQFGASPPGDCPPSIGGPLPSPPRLGGAGGRPLGGQPFVVGYAGRLVPEKGVALLLRACAGLGGPWQLRYLGAGPERERLGRLAGELGVADRVRFDAPLPATEVPRWLAEIDVLVLPSRTRPHWREQFGRVLVEAMLSGVPVVGSSSGEIPHLIGDAGLVFPEEDAAALRACLERLGADPALRSRLAAAGRARALAHYTHERIAAATYRVYREVLDEPWPDPRPRWTPPDEWQHPSPDEAMTRRGGPTVVGDAPSQAAAPAGAEPSDRTEGTR